MHKTRLTFAAAAALAMAMMPAVASAQPGAPPPPPPPGAGPGGYYAPEAEPSFGRQGLTLGFGFGLGGMSSEDGLLEQCLNCDYEPASFGFDFHIGGMVNPRLALLGEIWVTGQAVEASGRETLMQGLVMFAAQYWLTPQLWIKGGLGAANLSYSIDVGDEVISEDVDSGVAMMAGIGYEIMSSSRFALDLSLRLGQGSYDGINDQVSVGMIGVGFNWY